MNAPAPPRRIFKARRPTALVLPLLAMTEAAGILFLIEGLTSLGIVACAAPLLTLSGTALIVRPTIELTRDGIVQRQYPFKTVTRWDVIDDVALVSARSRTVLAYRLKPGIPPPRRQPAAALLRACAEPYDGGYFADSLNVAPQVILDEVRGCLTSEQRRQQLPAMQS